MQLTEDSFRALARSSPWRFTRLHFVANGLHPGETEAWLERPGRLKVVYDGTEREIVEDRRESTRVIGFARLESGEMPASYPDLGEIVTRLQVRLPHEVEPPLRSDGLVAERPDGVAYDDPMWQSYRWVAALDPWELSDGTEITDLREKVLDGRRTWWASMRPVEGYEPRCGCCPLLPNPISDAFEGIPERASYPSSYTVGLDVATGVVTSLDALGGDLGYDPAFEVEILASS